MVGIDKNKKISYKNTKKHWVKYLYSFCFSILVGFLLYFLLDSHFIKKVWRDIFSSKFINKHSKFIGTIGSACILTICFIVSGLIQNILELYFGEKINPNGLDNVIGFILGKVIVISILSILIIYGHIIT